MDEFVARRDEAVAFLRGSFEVLAACTRHLYELTRILEESRSARDFMLQSAAIPLTGHEAVDRFIAEMREMALNELGAPLRH